MNEMSLNTTVLSFAFSGMMPPHRRAADAPQRLPSPTAPKRK